MIVLLYISSIPELLSLLILALTALMALFPISEGKYYNLLSHIANSHSIFEWMNKLVNDGMVSRDKY